MKPNKYNFHKTSQLVSSFVWASHHLHCHPQATTCYLPSGKSGRGDSGLTLIYLQFTVHAIPTRSQGDSATLLQCHMLAKTYPVLSVSYKGMQSMSPVCDANSVLSMLLPCCSSCTLLCNIYTWLSNAFPLDVQMPLCLLCPKMPWSLQPVQSPHTVLFNTASTAMTTWTNPHLLYFPSQHLNHLTIFTREGFEKNIRHCLFVAESSTCLVYSLTYSRLNIHQDNIL